MDNSRRKQIITDWCHQMMDATSDSERRSLEHEITAGGELTEALEGFSEGLEMIGEYAEGIGGEAFSRSVLSKVSEVHDRTW